VLSTAGHLKFFNVRIDKRCWPGGKHGGRTFAASLFTEAFTR
jgi:hypothetical protein